MSEITINQIEGYIEATLSIRCANCGCSEVEATGDLSDDEELTKKLIETCISEGWEYSVIGDIEGVFCADCINGKNLW